ncbi:MAG: alpha/beta hydrolase [Burkholderiales bacterium]|nr:alpha/beta hydrolase [Burkholderiales bacterium]
MSTYVLIHGAWHGGWCWARVAARLRALGHTVHTPTLAGMGEHAHLLSRQITLDTHVEDVVSHFETEEIRDAILVGHSYGGLIVTGAADRLDGTGAISRLVYLDAVVPADGDHWTAFHSPEAAQARHAAARDRGGALFLPPPDAAVFGLTDPADLAWVARRLRPHPYGCYLVPLRLPRLAAGAGAAALPRTYIDCVEPFYSDFMGLKQRLKADPAWQYVELRTGHNAMVSAPDALTGLLCAPHVPRKETTA